MSKRTYTHIKVLESEILAMREAGKTQQEIAGVLGLQKEQIKEFMNRYHRRQRNLSIGILPQAKGRPRKATHLTSVQQTKEVERLRMENALLRDFLQLLGRR